MVQLCCITNIIAIDKDNVTWVAGTSLQINKGSLNFK